MRRQRGITRSVLALLIVAGLYVAPVAAEARSRIAIVVPDAVASGEVAAATIRLPETVAAIEGRVVFDTAAAELIGVAPLGAGTALAPVALSDGAAFGAYGMQPKNGRQELRLVFLPKITGRLELRVFVDALANANGKRLVSGPRELTGMTRVDGGGRRWSAPVGTARPAPTRTARAPRSVVGAAQITVNDLDVVRPAWYRTRAPGSACAPGTQASADANLDGCVDVVDLQAVLAVQGQAGVAKPASAMGSTAGAAASVTAAAVPVRTFVVTSTADTNDAAPGDGLCRDATGACTLRAAMRESNWLTGQSKIDFNLPGTAPVTIQVGSTPLPNVGATGSSMFIDGYSQPGSQPNTAAHGTNAVPGVEIRGPGNSGSSILLYVPQGGNVIRGLLLNNASRGIFLDTPASTGNLVIGNHIGFNRDNSLPPRGYAGVYINNGAHDNVVGTPALADRNVVGNWDKAIFSYGTGTNGNVVQNNVLCIKPNGATAICQIGVDHDFGPKNSLIGGSGPNEGNVTGPNCCNAIEFSHGWNPQGTPGQGGSVPWQVSGHRVIGNWLGFRVDGSYDPAYRSAQSVPSFDNGQAVNIYDGSLNNTVEGNYIGSAYDGVTIGTDTTTGNVVRNNFIGISPLGQPAPMAGWGVYLRWGTDVNTVSGNQIANAATGGIGLIEDNVHRITMSGNLVSATDGPAIFLAPSPGNPAQGANNLLAGPTLSATTSQASGTGIPGATVEVFRATRPLPGTGLPSQLLGSTTVAGGGNWSLPVSLATGDLVTALQTRIDGTTSSLTPNALVGTPPAEPVAEFTWTQAPNTLRVDFTDTSTGAPNTWAWNFGDGTTSTLQNPSHTYTTADDYTVTLTATNGGGSDQASHQVTVDPLPANPAVAADAFGRNMANGWGSADSGGSYTLYPSNSYFSVTGGTGRMVVTSPGNTRSATLASAITTHADMLVKVTPDKAPGSGAQYVYAFARANGTSAYQPKLIMYANGTVAVHAGVKVNGSESSLGNAVTVAGLTPAAGASIWMRAQVVGTNPTTIRVRAWADGQAEPSNWQFSATNSNAALQGSGGVGLAAYIGSNTTNAPVTFSFDDYVVVDPNAAPPVAPTADFSWSQQSGTLNVNFTDTSTGGPTGWLWDFGDGTTSTAQNPVHTYAAAGPRTVTLTASNAGGQTVKSAGINVQEPPPVTTIAEDAFNRTLSSSWGSADFGGPYTPSDSDAFLSVANGRGVMVPPRAGSTRGALLGNVSARDIDIVFRVSVDKRPIGGAVWVYAVSRRSGNNEYRPKIMFNANGTVSAHAGVVINGSESPVGPAVTVPGLTYTANDWIWVRAQVTGAGPTTIRVKAWADGQSEPSAWLFTGTDSAASLQGNGSVGLRTYISSSATNAPVTLRFDDYLVQVP